MNITDIPFIKYLGIIRNGKGLLELPFSKNLESYFQTQHAGSQFTLAETASIDYLQNTFPLLVGKSIPVLRRSEIKFKKLSKNNIIAIPTIDDDVRKHFEQQLTDKSRANIVVDIELIDSTGIVTFIGAFTWFVQLNQI